MYRPSVVFMISLLFCSFPLSALYGSLNTYMKTLKTLSVSHSDRSLLTALNNIEQICIGDMLLLFSQSNKTAIGNFELARVEFMTQLSQSCIQAMSSRMFAHDEFRV